ncbi:hypothetical protein FOA52_000002 [Chlamydomonas sp. UWO 241]|nr:hypothetical protein FOA52_000002 [Chlamydomonas sp. UWO 241]
MMMLAYRFGFTTLMYATVKGHADAMRLLLKHPSADTAAMMMLTDIRGCTALMFAAQDGHVNAIRMLLDHPSADVAARIAVRSTVGISALTSAAGFAAGQPTLSRRASPARSCTPLLFLLRRVAVEPQLCDTQ